MLERIREGSQGPWAMIIIGLVMLSFVFAGVGSYLNSSGQTVAATVNGQEISLNDLEKAYQSERRRMESQYGDAASTLFADDTYMQQFRRSVLDKLVGDALVEQKAEEMGLRIGDEQIKDTIRQMPEFQQSGQFSNDRYQSLLRQNGFQPADFSDYMRVELTREQLGRALGISGFALPGEVKRVYELQAQTRNADYLLIDSAPFAKEIDVTDGDIQNYYDANITQFDTEEEINVSYVTLSVDDLKDDVEINDEDIAKWYEDNKDQYTSEEQRRVSHILIETGDDASAAKEKAEALLAQIQSGADFATIAKENSDDSFSAEKGGDLEYITPGMMDDAFDSAAFSLASVGDVSDVVKTDFGYHIIKLTDLKPEEVQPLAEVKDDIRQSLATDKAMERFYELQSRMAEVAFEVPDSLDEVAGIAEQPVEETGLFTQSNPPAALTNPKALADAFSSELIEDRVNSDVIELDDKTVMVLRVKDHEPQRTQSLDEVKDRIVNTLRGEKAQQAAQDFANTLLTQINSGEDISDELEQNNLSWNSESEIARGGSSLPANLVSALFRLSAAEGENTQVVTLNNGNVGIVKLTGVNEVEPAEQGLLDQIQQRLASAYSQTLYQSYVDALRDDADVEINTVR